MRYGAGGTNFFAASAEYDALVGIYHCCFFAVFFFSFEGFLVAKVNAFFTGCAFGEVYFGVPGDLVARDSFVFGFGHVSVLL